MMTQPMGFTVLQLSTMRYLPKLWSGLSHSMVAGF